MIDREPLAEIAGALIFSEKNSQVKKSGKLFGDRYQNRDFYTFYNGGDLMNNFLLVSGVVIAILWIGDMITDYYQYKIAMKRLERQNENK